MEIIPERLLRQMGSMPPSPVRVKEEPPSPPCFYVKRGLASPLWRFREEPAPSHNHDAVHIRRRIQVEQVSPPSSNRGVQIGRRVKDEPMSPPTHIWYARIDGPLSSRRCNHHPIKEVLLPAITKAQAASSTTSETVVSAIPRSRGPSSLRRSAW